MKRIMIYLGLAVFLGQAGWSRTVSPVFHPRITGVSQQNLVSSRQINWQQDRPVLKTTPGEPAEADSIRILALMIQFQKDEDDKTTGDGHFDLSQTDSLILDPPPHDQEYFEDQLLALRNYYKHVSQGKLRIGYTVHPTILESPNQMGDYNPGTTDEAADKGLAELFRDAIQTADEAGVPFSEYDVFIVYHAGVGRDIDIGYDFSPKDIPSAFLNLNDLRKYLADDDPAYAGIFVQDGPPVTEGIILPETESQEENEFGLLGTSVLMFGFQLGLPALWNTETGVTGIGRWGLMDQGSGNFNGLIPAEPCAWSKVFMGWEKPEIRAAGTDLKVACSKAQAVPHIYQVPINDHEYFLIENRQYDPNGDGFTRGKDAAGRSVTFTESGQIEISEKIGVITEVEEYDYGLPGSGILIWHIDESVLLEKLAENKVNTDKTHRAVDLEEADGAQDIGENYGYLFSVLETGVLYDAWFSDNTDHMIANQSDSVTFTPKTHPNTKSYSGGNSHLVFSGFSKSDTVMTFSVSNDRMQSGFPKYFSEGLTPYPPLYGDLDGDGLPEIIVATREGHVFAWHHDGSPVVANNPTLWHITVSGDSIPYPSPLFVDADDSILVPPVIMNLTNGDILIIGMGNRVIGWGVQNDQAVSVFEQTMDSGVVTALAVIGDYLCAGSSTGKMVVFNRSFETVLDGAEESGISAFADFFPNTQGYAYGVTEKSVLFQIDFSKKDFGNLKDLDLDADEKIRYIFNSPDGLVFSSSSNRFYLAPNASDAQSVRTGDTPPADFAVALADVNDDGHYDVVYSSEGQLHAVYFDGVTTVNFPFPMTERNVVMSSPVAADVNDDGEIELCVTTDNGNLEIYNPNGKQIEGAPLAVGGTLAVTPTFADIDQDGDIDCITVSNAGLVQVWDFSGNYSEASVPWGSYLHDPRHTALNPNQLEAHVPGSDFFPTNLAYNYPNPNIENFTVIRYRLEQPAKIFIKIYDLVGELIDSFSGPGNAPADNEVIWRLDGVDSGVYFCQVKASGTAGEKTATFKIAVVK